MCTMFITDHINVTYNVNVHVCILLYINMLCVSVDLRSPLVPPNMKQEVVLKYMDKTILL